MSEHMPTTDQDLDLDHLEALANQKRGRGYREEQILVGAVPPLVAEVRRLREAITEFAKQHGLGDLESRPLYDAQQQLADAKSEIERLRVVERELDGQRLELAAAWETACEAVGVDTDSTLGEWQTAFDERVAHYHASGYKAGKRDALEEAAEAFNAELGSNAANPGPKYVVGWLHNRAAKLGAK